jgi:hypothetical protein
VVSKCAPAAVENSTKPLCFRRSALFAARAPARHGHYHECVDAPCCSGHAGGDAHAGQPGCSPASTGAPPSLPLVASPRRAAPARRCRAWPCVCGPSAGRCRRLGEGVEASDSTSPFWPNNLRRRAHTAQASSSSRLRRVTVAIAAPERPTTLPQGARRAGSRASRLGPGPLTPARPLHSHSARPGAQVAAGGGPHRQP